MDLESGKTLSETNVEQFVDALPFPDIVDSKYLVGALLDGGTLYVMSKDLELYAINASPSGRGRCVAAGEGPKDAQILRSSPGAARRPLPEGEGSCVRWHTPIHKRMQAIRAHGRYVYLGTNDGELIVMDAVSGMMLNKAELTREPLLIDYAGDDAVLAGSNNTLYGLDPAGIKKWEYPSVDPLMEATYFNGTVTVYTSPVQMAALDVMTGKVLFQYIGDQKPYVFANDARFHFVDESGVKEYAVKQTPQAVTDMETLTELGRVYQAKGDLTRARVFVDKASEIDVNYPPVVLVRSRLLKAEGHTDAAGRELAKYVSLLGFDSKEGQSAISEMKRDYRLLWVAAIGPNVAGEPLTLSSIGNRLVNVGRRVGHFADIVALDPETGAVVWSYRGERYLASVAEPPYVWYVSSSQSDGTLLNLYRIDVRTGERQLMESKHSAARVDQAWIASESGHVRVLTTPPGETKPKRLQSPNALWDPAAFLIQNGRLYAYTSDGRAYAMQLN